MKKLLLSLLIVVMLTAVIAMPVVAASTDSTEVTGSLDGFIDVEAPSSIELGVFTGSEEYPGTFKVYVHTNFCMGWTVTATGADDGRLTGDDGESKLTNPLMIGFDQGDMRPANEGVVWEGTGAGFERDFFVNQVIVEEDMGLPAGGYGLTLVFQGTPGAPVP